MKRTYTIVAGVIVLVFGLYLYFSSPKEYVRPVSRVSTSVILGGKTFSADVADTEESRNKGLSGRTDLSSDSGLLFVFDTPGNYGFWMKDMNFPIDIVWIGPDYTITHIEKSLSPATYPNVFYPNKPSLYVFEISSGQSDTLGIKIGDRVTISRE